MSLAADNNYDDLIEFETNYDYSEMEWTPETKEMPRVEEPDINTINICEERTKRDDEKTPINNTTATTSSSSAATSIEKENNQQTYYFENMNVCNNNGQFCQRMKGTRKKSTPAKYMKKNDLINYNNRPVFLIDIQTICKYISEVAIYSKGYPPFHQYYKIPSMKLENDHSFNHNKDYVGWTEKINETGQRYRKYNDRHIFERGDNLRGAIFIFRGNAKRLYVQNLVRRYKLYGVSLFTFPVMFDNNLQCIKHCRVGTSCAMGNVIQMIDYYKIIDDNWQFKKNQNY